MTPAPLHHAGLRTTAEELARDAYNAGNITQAVVQQVLSLINVPSSTSRKNVMPKGVGQVKGMVLGLYVHADQCDLTSATAKYPHTTT